MWVWTVGLKNCWKSRKKASRSEAGPLYIEWRATWKKKTELKKSLTLKRQQRNAIQTTPSLGGFRKLPPPLNEGLPSSAKYRYYSEVTAGQAIEMHHSAFKLLVKSKNKQSIEYIKLTNSMAYRTRRFNAAFTRALQQFLSWAQSTLFPALIPISSRSILILSSHLRLGLSKCIFNNNNNNNNNNYYY